MSWISQRIYFNAEEGKTMGATTTGSVVSTKKPVVTMTQWARISAKAWLEGEWLDGKVGGKWLPGRYQKLLETNPFEALNLVRKEFGIRCDARHFDIDDPTYGGGTDESGSEPRFNTLEQGQLETIIKYGKLTLPDGRPEDARPAKMIPSEWVSYPPLYTQSREHAEHPGDGSTLSLLEWARIIAYLYWFEKVDLDRFRALKDHFETDPAAAVHTIANGGLVSGEKGEFRIKSLKEEEFKSLKGEEFKTAPEITFIHKTTALFRLGDPPNPKLVSLQEVLANPNGYARVLVRLCC
jgi:hypothetical protein